MAAARCPRAEAELQSRSQPSVTTSSSSSTSGQETGKSASAVAAVGRRRPLTKSIQAETSSPR
eukprot:3457216-Pyramimonas_sp.AAC.1